MTTFHEIHPIAGTVMNSHFRDTLTNRRGVAEITVFRTINPDLNTHPSLPVSQRLKPLLKDLGCLYLVHCLQCIPKVTKIKICLSALQRITNQQRFQQRQLVGQRQSQISQRR